MVLPRYFLFKLSHFVCMVIIFFLQHQFEKNAAAVILESHILCLQALGTSCPAFQCGGK